jgi:hypothetical protein
MRPPLFLYIKLGQRIYLDAIHAHVVANFRSSNARQSVCIFDSSGRNLRCVAAGGNHHSVSQTILPIRSQRSARPCYTNIRPALKCRWEAVGEKHRAITIAYAAAFSCVMRATTCRSTSTGCAPDTRYL